MAGEEARATAKTALYGIKAIRDCCRNLELPSSEASVMAMIIKFGLPAYKIGGIWIADQEAIAKWRHEYAVAGPPQKDTLSRGASKSAQAEGTDK